MVLPEGTVDTTIIIRSEKVKDIPVECEPSWTVANLKEHLSKTYPGNPKENKQRLIWAGKLLQDSTQLEDIFKVNDFQPIVHFMCTQTLSSNTPSEPDSITVTSSRSTRSSSPANSTIDQATPRIRSVPQLPSGPSNIRWNAHLSQLHTWHQQLAAQNEQLQASVGRAGQVEEDEGNAELGDEQQQQQQLPQQQQPPQQPRNPEDEERHDLLDVFYLIIRGMILLALAWNYASPAKFCFMSVFLFYLYLYQSGLITLPAVITGNRGQIEQEGDEPPRPSFFTLFRAAIISFFSSLMPSNENMQ